MKILIVDDNTMARKILHSILEKHGCKILEAANGIDGLQKVRIYAPDLVICDALMPRMDGYQFLREVKGDPAIREIPVVINSAIFSSRKDEELALSLGAAAFIVKPNEPQSLWTELCAIMARHGTDIAGEDECLPEEEYLRKHSRLMAQKLTEKVRELEKAKAELERSEQRYKRLLESVTDYIYTVQIEAGRPLAASHGPGCTAVTGYTPEEFAAAPDLWFRMIHDEDRQTLMEQVALFLSGKGAPLTFEHRIIRKDGQVRWVRNTPVPRYDEHDRLIGYDGLISDITEYKKLEDQYRHSQKMEAVGVLAGGIAHDFNNILTAILGYGNLLQMQLNNGVPARHHVEQILSATEKAANLTHGLLAFSRKQIINPKPVNLNDIITSMEKLLSRLITEDTDLRVNLAAAETAIMADSSQIDQILMNLTANARDAMPKGGILAIETAIMEMDTEYVKSHGYGTQGFYVQLSVSDTGMGIDEQAKERIFEPFFTTKPVGKGTGLGLSIVYGIVKQHNGYISVYSEPGMGTTFEMYFPLINMKGEEPSAVLPLPVVGGKQTILVADDDTQVRNIIRAILENSGYKVVEAEDGEKAVQQFAKNRGNVDLLILDVVMPRENGREAYDEIRKLQPDVRALFMSGYTADVIHQKGGTGAEVTVVAKPVSPRRLLLAVREALEHP